MPPSDAKIPDGRPSDARDPSARGLSALEPIELRMLPPEGLRFDEPVPKAWFQSTLGRTTDTGQAIEILAEGRLTIEVTPLGDVSDRPPVRINGKIEGRVRTACVRCLEDVDLDVGDQVETTLFASEAPKAAATERGTKGKPSNPKDQALEDWSDADLPSLSELDDGGYVGERVDVPAILEEAVALSMDLNPTCADEPSCDVRTQNLLDEANRPAREAESALDPRWAALANLKTPESTDS